MPGKIIGLLLAIFCSVFAFTWKPESDRERKANQILRFISGFVTGWFLVDILKVLI